MRSRILAALALAMLPAAVFPSPRMRDEFVPPVVTVRRFSAGELAGKSAAQAIWARPATIPGLDFARLGRLASAKSEVRLAYDDKNLYVAYRCFFGDRGGITAIRKNRDGSLASDDAVMMILEPTNNPRAYFYLAANTIGTRYDERDKRDPSSWDGDWSVELAKEANAWTALVTVPFKSLDVEAPKPGTTWSANIGRNWPPRKEASFWANTLIDFHEPRRTGRLLFAGADAVAASVAVPIVKAPGRYALSLVASNPSSKAVRLTATVMSDGAEIARLNGDAKPGTSELKLDFTYPYDGWHDLSAVVVDASTKELIARSPQAPARSADYRSKLERFAKMLEEPAPPGASANEISGLKKNVAGLLAQARDAEGDGAKWKALRAGVEKTELAARRIQALQADKNGAGYAVGTESAASRVMRDKLFEGRFGEPLKISACRDEFESGQVVVLAHERALKNVSVSVTQLRGPNGAVIPEKQVKVDLVDFVETCDPAYEVNYVGWYPDPIVDLKPFDLAAGGIRPVWVTVHIPVDAPAGVYRGEVTVKPEGAPTTSVPVEVEVWDFALPKRLHLKTAFAFSEGELAAWYGKPTTREQRLEWYAFLLDHRINPTNIYTKQPIPRQEDMQFCVDRGLNAYTVMCTGYKEGKPLEDVIAVIRENEQFAKAHGWWDMAFLYGFDELGRDRYAALCSTYGAIKKAVPDLPRMTTVIPNQELKGCVDIWVPLTPNFDPDIAREYIKNGDQVWWYVCCNPPHPYANFLIDYPAMDSRIIFWMNWKYHVPGFLYYMIDLWGSNRTSQAAKGVKVHYDPEVLKAIAAGKRWPEIPWNSYSCASFNGDGQLVYPGLNGKPWSSMRLECIRDGIEDYEYFYMLNSLVEDAAKKPGADSALIAEAKKLLEVRSDVVTSVTDYTLDPDALLGARRQVAEMIERLSK